MARGAPIGRATVIVCGPSPRRESSVRMSYLFSVSSWPRRVSSAAVVIACVGTVVCSPAFAQPRSEEGARGEVQSIDRAIDRARERQKQLEAEAAAHAKELEALRRQSVAVAGRVQEHEAAASATELKLRDLRHRIAETEQALADGRERMVATLTALQRLAQRPPEALVAMPGSPVDAVRTATLLGAVVPPLERQAAELRERIATLAQLREEGRRERTALANQLVSLRRERAELAEVTRRTAVLRDRA